MASTRPILHPSPNQGARRDGLRPHLVVLHYTAMTTAGAALARLCEPGAEVSAHYLVSETGETWQLVEEEQRAWHAGQGQWQGRGDVNSRSIGIELANTGAHPFPAPQMRVLHGLLGGIMARWQIPPEGVIAHSDMAPARKCDPGPRFDWRALALRGFSVWPRDGDAGGGDFFADAAAFGYDLAQDDTARAQILSAFRLRFRPWARGPLDATDAALARDLARRFGIDRAAATA